MSKGRPRDTFVVGALLTLPGASYLAGLGEISKQDLSTPATVLAVTEKARLRAVVAQSPLVHEAFLRERREALENNREYLFGDVVDGNARGLHPATVAVLDQLGLLGEAQRTELSAWREPTLRNYRGIVTGKVSPVVDLRARG